MTTMQEHINAQRQSFKSWIVTWEDYRYDKQSEDWDRKLVDLYESSDLGSAVNMLMTDFQSRPWEIMASSADSPRWFTLVDTCPFTGDIIETTLHVPPQVTNASRNRLKRLLGAH